VVPFQYTPTQLFSLRETTMHWEVRGHCMCKEMLVIPVNRVVDPKGLIGKNGGLRRRRGIRGPLTPQKKFQWSPNTTNGLFFTPPPHFSKFKYYIQTIFRTKRVCVLKAPCMYLCKSACMYICRQDITSIWKLDDSSVKQEHFHEFYQTRNI
jgi:hypothetical protein